MKWQIKEQGRYALSLRGLEEELSEERY